MHNVLLCFSHYLSDVSIFGRDLVPQSKPTCVSASAFVSIIKRAGGPTHLTLKAEEEQGWKLDKRHEMFHLQSGVLLAFVLLVHLDPQA